MASRGANNKDRLVKKDRGRGGCEISATRVVRFDIVDLARPIGRSSTRLGTGLQYDVHGLQGSMHRFLDLVGMHQRVV